MPKTKSKTSAKAKKAAPGRTNVTFLLDRSGSMESVRDDTIGAFNAYLDGLKGGDIEFSLVQFDSISIDKVCVREPIDKVTKLTRRAYEPRSSTPLIDAAYKTIQAVEASLVGDTKTKVVICIQTDGQENSSTEHTWDELNALIKEKSKLGWQFNFMGVGIDAYDQGARMGIARSSTVAYQPHNPTANLAAFTASASNTSAFACGTRSSTAYTDTQKLAAGDEYDNDLSLNQPSGTFGQSRLLTGGGAGNTSLGAKPKARNKIVDDVKL